MVNVGKKIGKKRQKFIAYFMAEIPYLPWRSHKTGSVDHVRPSIQQRSQHDRIILRRVFKIRILNQDKIPGGFFKPPGSELPLFPD